MQCCSSGNVDFPERFKIEGCRFFTAVMQRTMALCSIAEGQQGQHAQPDARLAVRHCLGAAESCMRSGLPFVPVPPVCIMLTELAGRVMASFATAPEAASAASVLLLPISFLDAVGVCTSECAQKLVAARRSLLASVRLLLEGPVPLLSAPSVSAHGPTFVVEAAILLVSAIGTAAWARAGAAPPVATQIAAQVLQQLQALLADPFAAQMKERLRYPLCSLFRVQSISVAAQLVQLEICLLKDVIALMTELLNSRPCRQNLIASLAGCQQQILAVAAAVARPTLVRSSGVWPPDCGQQPACAVYQGAVLLARFASLSAEALHRDPSSVCQPTGLGSVVVAAAVSALAFAEVDDNSNTTRPAGVADVMQGCMQYAANAVRFLHVLAQQLLKPSRTNAEAARSALTTRGAAQSLVQLLLWLSEPTTAVATASGVLQEALLALQLMVAGEETPQLLAAEGGPHEWEPVAAALRRRLPRRMAARFLPEVNRVSAAVARRTGNAAGNVDIDAAAVAAAEVAMAELLQVRALASM